MTQLEFTVERSSTASESLSLRVGRGYNLGYTIRDAERMQAHIDEVGKLGVFPPVPTRPPLIFGISPFAWTNATEILVQGSHTSGEVEILVVDLGDRLLVGVGSDHTDRDLERTDIPWAKQVCENVVAPTLWDWEDVSGHWDECILESFVTINGKEEQYQHASVSEFWQPPELSAGVMGRVPDVFPRLLLSGTVVSVTGEIQFGTAWRIRIVDPVLQRAIEHRYTVTILEDEIDSD